MAFLRIKTVKGKEYAYLVENHWQDKKSRQRVRDYLGRAYRFVLKNDLDFLKFLKMPDYVDYIKNNDKNAVINDLIEWEFFRHDVKKDEFSIDLKSGIIQKNRRKVVFLFNEGFMCKNTLDNLIGFKMGVENENDAYRFAKAFVDAGIKVPQEVFVGLFEKQR